jgi:hypothetical protein
LEPVQTVGAGVVTSTGGEVVVVAGVVGAGVVTSTGGSVVSGTQLRLLEPMQTVGAGVVTSTGGEVVVVQSMQVGHSLPVRLLLTTTTAPQGHVGQVVGAGVVTSTGGAVVVVTQLRLLAPEHTSTGAEVVVLVEVLLNFSAEQKAMIAKTANARRIVRIVVMMLCCFVVLLLVEFQMLVIYCVLKTCNYIKKENQISHFLFLNRVT